MANGIGQEVKVAQQLPSYDRDGTYKQLRAIADGSQVVLPWVQALVLEGRVWQVSVGAGTTPVGDGTTWAVARPMLTIGSPTGTSVMALRVDITLNTPLSAADDDEVEFLIGVDRDTMVTGGAATEETPFNMRTDLVGTINVIGQSTRVAVRSVYTADATPTPAVDMELLHTMISFDIFSTGVGVFWQGIQGLYEPETKPVIVGPGSLLQYHNGTVATTGFVSAVWAEFPSNIIT